MTKQICFWLILFSTTLFAQNSVELGKDSATKGEQILKAAQKAAGTESMDISSFKLKTKSTIDAKFDERMRESTNEISALLPGKIRTVSIFEQLGNFTNTRIWNEEKYKAISETDLFGSRIVKDVTNSSLSGEVLGKIGNKAGKGKTDTFREYSIKSPKEMFYATIWQVFFPITLIQPFEKNLEFNYAGRAKSGNRVANVVDVKAQNETSYRLLFDSETNHLLMMIESFKSKNGDNENKYYYTNREMVNNISVPKKIKVEGKFTPTGEKPRLSYQNIDVLELGVNLEFKKGLFDVN